MSYKGILKTHREVLKIVLPNQRKLRINQVDWDDLTYAAEINGLSFDRPLAEFAKEAIDKLGIKHKDLIVECRVYWN